MGAGRADIYADAIATNRRKCADYHATPPGVAKLCSSALMTSLESLYNSLNNACL